jgi:hypothetical protein
MKIGTKSTCVKKRARNKVTGQVGFVCAHRALFALC